MNPDGSLSDFRLFAEQGGEGVAVDSRGNVYIAAGQVYVYSPAGQTYRPHRSARAPLAARFRRR